MLSLSSLYRPCLVVLIGALLLGCGRVSDEPSAPQTLAAPSVTSSRLIADITADERGAKQNVDKAAPTQQASTQSLRTPVDQGVDQGQVNQEPERTDPVATTPDMLKDVDITVVKNTGCGCCEAWGDHLRAAGATVTMREQDAAGRTAFFSIPAHLSSCHTGTVRQYVFEGHVPASAIADYLNNPVPGSMGLVVPNMPIGSPGMEMGGRRDAFDVLVLYPQGTTSVYRSYPALP